MLLAVLVLYLYTISTATNEQDKKNSAKTIYHAFSMVSYFTGVLGAMAADSWFGKFKYGNMFKLSNRNCLWSHTDITVTHITSTLNRQSVAAVVN